ncbi:CopG family antitoxin [Devosia naphthalenivorans]|uniref:CopG family antitoxin n=1 Tax=Devosia naphthalenivorans TaxID=2082392 RepID=UPI000D3B4E7D|nr:CopG family antitoxin [Devosia naphthalenivorans]
MSKTPKPAPTFASEAEERAFWEANDSSKHVDWSQAERTHLPNLKPSSTAISLRLPNGLLERIKTWLAEKIDASRH